MMAGLVISAMSVRQAIRRSGWSQHGRLWFAVPSTLLAGSVAIMTLGVLGWGWFAEQYAVSDFHLRNGGLFSNTNFASWLASCKVFWAATVVAVKGARSALALKMQ
jgi:hypothetical protein